ncbi:MAG: RluA family pseudouridine synthase [Bacteroidales bacterium]|jgi:23S rRNA pseudouridine1911/1915/1917 synthase|nr:RluA family pseudouridine synthase [Bacteroidales bacterium]MCI2121596.1 RluA family pseudouridine synthase [Bacteroidales bacterium]MCI2145686.1 RluA family pseudouridine synthase [Bacteroidales bacterium]
MEDRIEEDFNEEELYEHFRFVVDKGQTPMRVDKYIADHMESTSRHRVQLAIEAGYVRCGDKILKGSYKVKPDDILSLLLPYKRHESELTSENIPLEVVYEDDDVLVINKQAGLVVHPGFGHFRGTLLNALAYHAGIPAGESAEGDTRMPLLVHRIDKDTSGLLLVAKNDDAQIFLASQFFNHTVERKYVAMVWGNLTDDSGTIEGNIARDPNDRLRFKVFPDGERGRHAVTHYKVIERFGYVTLVECVLETGRTHQIRVHMDYIGHPLFNDDRYGGNRILKGTIYSKYRQFIDNCFETMPRQALHAKTIGFVHPSTKRIMRFDSELPEDFSALIGKWKRYTDGNEAVKAINGK